jgi:hypothetical protein
MNIEKIALKFLRRRKLKQVVQLCLPTAPGREILVRLCLQDKELDRFFKGYVTGALSPPEAYGVRILEMMKFLETQRSFAEVGWATAEDVAAACCHLGATVEHIRLMVQEDPNFFGGKIVFSGGAKDA